MDVNSILIGNEIVSLDNIARISADKVGEQVQITITEYDNRSFVIRLPKSDKSAEDAAKDVYDNIHKLYRTFEDV